MNTLKNIEWIGDADNGHLRLLDQTVLPNEITYLDCKEMEQVWGAIKRLSVRGAPAIGVTAGYACVLAVQDTDDCEGQLKKQAKYLATSRPTAVNLFWALDRMQKVQPCTPAALLAEAIAIHEEDQQMCRRIGEHAQVLLEKHLTDQCRGIITHCNAGALATGGMGTATAPMYVAHEKGVEIKVFADETRPLLQGARLTALELDAAGIDVTVVCDNMAAQVMREGRIAMAIVGSDRIAANGDAANKIGTYSLAIAAKHHNVPFYVAAPSSTFDMTLADGSMIPIELREADEIVNGFGMRTGPEGIGTYNPAFDVTPNDLIAGIITEKGIISPVSTEQVKEILGDAC